MDKELEDLIDYNDTDTLNNFSYKLTTWDYVQYTTEIVIITVALLSDITIIYMIARNARMQSKTNILLMNFIINNALCLVCNEYLWVAILEIFGYNLHISDTYNCVLEYTDFGFQANENLFLLIIVSNTLIKNKHLKIKTFLIVVYAIIAGSFVLSQISCYLHFVPLSAYFFTGLILLTFVVILFKEFNNCYKKWYKQNPLSEHTKLRLNIARMFLACSLFTFCLYPLAELNFISFRTVNILTQNTYLIGFYVLLYLVKYDKNFKICFLTLIRNRGAAEYNVDATITFAHDLSEDSQDGNQGNINFNAMENVRPS